MTHDNKGRTFPTTFRVPPTTHTTIRRLIAHRLDDGHKNTDLNPTDDERRILDAARAAAVALKRTFDNWVTMGRGLQLLRKKADILGTRNAFNDLRDQLGLGDRFFNKTLVSKLLRVMDELEAVEKWRATLTEKQRFEWASPDAIGVQSAAGCRRQAQAVGLRQA